jgi:hypothetical protein
VDSTDIYSATAESILTRQGIAFGFFVLVSKMGQKGKKADFALDVRWRYW